MISINSTNVTIMVKSMDASIRFYESIGLRLKQRWGDHYAMVETAGLTIGIHPGGDENSGSGTVSVGFMIKDINEAKTLLEENNITGTTQDDGKSGIYLHFKDPDGTVLYFVQPKW
ncbi:MAG TPA: VOC family protein [Ferruginibacter sp.]|nr:VOC family protein [Ferruginibacter sp.]